MKESGLTSSTGLLSRPARMGARLAQPQALRKALWIVPLVFGLLSILLRQDNNWDLRNYHLYNPFALLNGKIGLDLAPAQMQTYFNPAIDLLYYGLIKALPGPLAGFVMGALHGLNFILVALLARELLPQRERGGNTRLCLLLALAGMFGVGFISELGNTMGDNLTALFVLGPLLLLVRHWPQLARQAAGPAAGAALAAGLLAGLGAGLKLTNAVYALSLCLALLALPASLWQRLRMSFVFGIGVLGGMAATGGFWYWKMWTLFGNPLFPQFNAFFHGPLASPMGVGDLRWLPHGLGEKILWPFIFALDPQRVSEIKLWLFAWPVLYVAFIALAVAALLRRRTGQASAPAPAQEAQSRQRALWAFFALSYLIWLNLFSIYRYLIPLELLAPLVLWLIARRLLPAAIAGKAVAVVLALIILPSLHAPSWGRVGWAREVYRAEVPRIAEPQQSMVFTVHADPPMGWLATLFPADLAFAALGSGFPESDAFRQRLADMVAARKGPLYLMVKGERALSDPRAGSEQRTAAREADRATLDKARTLLAAYGLVLDAATCKTYPAFMGRAQMDFQLCRVTPQGAAGA